MAGKTSSWYRPVRAIRRLLIRPHHDVHVAIWAWGSLAILCLAAGFLIADNPSRSEAYFDVRHWLRAWRTGANVYELPLFVDYPPHALMFLSPLSWFPAQHGELWFAAFNILVCIATSWTIVSLTSGWAGVELTRIERLAYVLMLLVWSPTRVGIWNGQTSPFLILCCCLALRLSSWSPVVAGILLAIGASKPHIAFGFALLAAFVRMWKMLAVSAIVVVAAWIAYAISVSRSPVAVFWQYIDTLFSLYGGPQFLRAEVDIRPFFVDAFGNYAIGEPLYLAASAVLGAVLLLLTWRARNNPDAAAWVMASGLMWAIAVFPFRRYGLLLIAPTVLLLLWRPGLSERMLTLVGVMIFVIAADVPFLLRHAIVQYGPAAATRYAEMTHYVNRFATVICLVISYAALARASRPIALPK